MLSQLAMVAGGVLAYKRDWVEVNSDNVKGDAKKAAKRAKDAVDPR